MRLNAIADKWANDIVSLWNLAYSGHPQDVLRAARANNHVLTVGLFIEQHHWWLAGVFLDENRLAQPIFFKTLGDSDFAGKCWPCHQRKGNQICALGEDQPISTIAGACSESTAAWEKDWHEWEKTISPSLRRKLGEDELWPITLAEMSIASDTSGTVHGPIDLVEIAPDGNIRWLNRKTNCPRSQD